jgi:SRSO17 transposase
MNLPREAIATVSLVDQYCAAYQDLFPEVRSYECFKFLHLGIISELKRKSLPAIAKAVGLENPQPLHHFLANSRKGSSRCQEYAHAIVKTCFERARIYLMY